MKTKLFSNFGILFFLTIGALNITALDLKFNSGITKSPVIFYEGDVVTFTVNFISRGGIATNLKIIGGVDEAQAFERVFTSLPDGANQKISFTWRAISGNHKAWFVLDPDHSTGDMNYRNNRVELEVTTSIRKLPAGDESNLIADKPDLAVTGVKLTKDTSANDKYFYQIKIKNKGGGCVSGFDWAMISEHSGVNLCSSCPKGRIAARPPLCALKAGEEKTLNGSVLKSDFSDSVRNQCTVGPFPSPKYRLFNPVYIILDPDNEVDESNEANNKTATVQLLWDNQCD